MGLGWAGLFWRNQLTSLWHMRKDGSAHTPPHTPPIRSLYCISLLVGMSIAIRSWYQTCAFAFLTKEILGGGRLQVVPYTELRKDVPRLVEALNVWYGGCKPYKNMRAPVLWSPFFCFLNYGFAVGAAMDREDPGADRRRGRFLAAAELCQPLLEGVGLGLGVEHGYCFPIGL